MAGPQHLSIPPCGCGPGLSLTPAGSAPPDPGGGGDYEFGAFTPVAHFDPGEGITMDGSNNVSRWDSAVAGGWYVEQTNGAYQPVWSAALLGGNPCVSFGGGLVQLVGTAASLANPCLLIAVSTQADASNFNVVGDYDAGDVGRRNWYLRTAGSGDLWLSAYDDTDSYRNMANIPFGDGVDGAVAMILQDGNQSVYFTGEGWDATPGTRGYPGTHTPAGFSIGGILNTGGGWNGLIGDVILWDAAGIDQAYLDARIAEMATKYGW